MGQHRATSKRHGTPTGSADCGTTLCTTGQDYRAAPRPSLHLNDVKALAIGVRKLIQGRRINHKKIKITQTPEKFNLILSISNYNVTLHSSGITDS